MREVHVLIAHLALVVGQQSIYNEKPSTVLECQCKSECATSGFFNCYVAPFCAVQSKDCAKGTAAWSITHGYYDYCVFGTYRPYEEQTAAEKQNLLLEQSNGDGSPSSYPFPPTGVLTGIMQESVMVTFDAQADIFPQERSKYIHSVGVVGGIKFRSAGSHPYTGIFKGADYGLVRLSSAKQPGLPGFPDVFPSWTPGAAFKFLRDGRPSANFVAMPSLDGQHCTENNFFANDFTNHVQGTSDFALQLVAAKFWQASYCPLMVGLSDLAAEASSNESTFPWKLVLHPLVSVNCSCLSYKSDCLPKFAALKPGTDLFEVRAASNPGADMQTIGYIVLTTSLSASKFGDERLFFRHQHMEEDFQAKPSWLQQIDVKEKCGMGCASQHKPTIEKGCQSPFNRTESSMRQDDRLTV